MSKKKAYSLIIILILLFLIIIKVLFGQINLKIKVPYDNPIYQLKINNEIKGLNMEVKKSIPIVPHFLNFISSAHVFTTPSKFTIPFGEPIIVDISGYYCFSDITGKEIQISCTDYNHPIMKEIETVALKQMKITGGSTDGLTGHLIYEGVFKKNIADIIKSKGIYQIEIMLDHENINSNLIFIVDVR